MMLESDFFTASLNDLRNSLEIIKAPAQRALYIETPRLSRLNQVIAGLGQQKPARAPATPRKVLDQWQDFIAGRIRDLDARSVRFLCWEPDVGTDPRFHGFLNRSGVAPVGPRSLQGLVRACHARWCIQLAKSPVVRDVRRAVDEYSGPNRVLGLWRDASGLILGPGGPAQLGARMADKLQSPKGLFDSLHIDSQSPFAVDVVRECVAFCRDHLESNEPLLAFMCQTLFKWGNFPLDLFKNEVGQCILHRSARLSRVENMLCDCVRLDDRLGDPRVPARQKNWFAMAPEARVKIIEWLSKYDILFFFEHAFPKREDKHGRRAFWLNYVSRIEASRPLLNPDDRDSLNSQSRKESTFGMMYGANSAFVLDFGRVVAVEFNRVGACYVYEKRAWAELVPDLWAPFMFTESKLKDRVRCAVRISHNPGWQDDLRRELARHGVRP
jgi:hypothetical protein